MDINVFIDKFADEFVSILKQKVLLQVQVEELEKVNKELLEQLKLSQATVDKLNRKTKKDD